MKSIRKHTMYLGNRIFGIVYVYLIGMLFLSACAEGERYINNEEESIVALEVLYALKDFLIKQLGSLLEHTTQN